MCALRDETADRKQRQILPVLPHVAPALWAMLSVVCVEGCRVVLIFELLAVFCSSDAVFFQMTERVGCVLCVGG
jgi:hypothetical protein